MTAPRASDLDGPVGPISNWELMRELTRRSDEIALRLARMDSDTVDYRKSHHAQIDKVNVALGKIEIDLAKHTAVNNTRLDAHDDDIADLKADVKTVTTRAAQISGGLGLVGAAASALGWIFGGKH